MIVGLTGGIGSGKSTVGEMFNALKIPLYNSDIEAKQIMHTSAQVKNAIVDLFGPQAYFKNILNKDYISRTVFNDGSMLKKLNAIVHPAVKKDFLEWTNNQVAPYVIQESAIIFENGSHMNYDKIILVTAPENERIERVMKRDTISRKKVLARIQHQWKDAEKAKLADYTIENKNIDQTKLRIQEIHDQLLQLVV